MKLCNQDIDGGYYILEEFFETVNFEKNQQTFDIC